MTSWHTTPQEIGDPIAAGCIATPIHILAQLHIQFVQLLGQLEKQEPKSVQQHNGMAAVLPRTASIHSASVERTMLHVKQDSEMAMEMDNHNNDNRETTCRGLQEAPRSYIGERFPLSAVCDTTFAGSSGQTDRDRPTDTANQKRPIN